MWHTHVYLKYRIRANIDRTNVIIDILLHQKLRNKLHGPMHNKIGVTRVYNRHLNYIRCFITRQSNPPI